MIKYIGSKRRLAPTIVRTCLALTGGRPGVALDLFSGTSRVGHALKREGWRVLACDSNAYAHALASCYVQADRERVPARKGEAGAHDGGREAALGPDVLDHR